MTRPRAVVHIALYDCGARGKFNVVAVRSPKGAVTASVTGPRGAKQYTISPCRRFTSDVCRQALDRFLEETA